MNNIDDCKVIYSSIPTPFYDQDESKNTIESISNSLNSFEVIGKSLRVDTVFTKNKPELISVIDSYNPVKRVLSPSENKRY